VSDIVTLVKMREISFDVAEREILGFNHCDVGAELAKYWKLPELFVEIARYHHTVYGCSHGYELFVKVIHIADILAYKTKIGIGIDGNSYKLEYKIVDELNLDKNFQKDIISKVRTSMKEFERALM